jgi:hypothetical protein
MTDSTSISAYHLEQCQRKCDYIICICPGFDLIHLDSYYDSDADLNLLKDKIIVFLG